jgi:hypothetical protein
MCDKGGILDTLKQSEKAIHPLEPTFGFFLERQGFITLL